MNENPPFSPEISSTITKKKLYPWGKINLGLFLSCCVGIVWYCVQGASQPVEGIITIAQSAYDSAQSDKLLRTERFEKHFFSLTLVETYEKRERNTVIAHGATLREQAYFVDTAESSRKIAVTIDEKPHIQLTDLTSYIYRKAHPDIYHEHKRMWHDQEITTFEKNDSVYEIVAYLPNNHQFVASVALVSTAETPEQLITDFSEILALFEWVK